jgi:hypothetical protein
MFVRNKARTLVSNIAIGLIGSIAPAVAQDAQGPNLNHLSKAEYDRFNEMIFHEYQKDPQRVGEQAEQILIGMLGLEGKEWTHKVFEIDVNYTTNTMLLLVANANKIKRGKTFIDEYKKQSEATAKLLHEEAQVMFLETTTDLLIRENGKLPTGPRKASSVVFRFFIYVAVAGGVVALVGLFRRLITRRRVT